jgi:hypothetical protein
MIFCSDGVPYCTYNVADFCAFHDFPETRPWDEEARGISSSSCDIGELEDERTFLSIMGLSIRYYVS